MMDATENILLSLQAAGITHHQAEQILAEHDAAVLDQPVDALHRLLRTDSQPGDTPADVDGQANRLVLALRDHILAEEKATAPGLTERQTRLLDAVRTHRGTWTTARVLDLYRSTDPGAVLRATARRDLTRLHRAGHLALVDDPDRRHYTLATRKDI